MIQLYQGRLAASLQNQFMQLDRSIAILQCTLFRSFIARVFSGIGSAHCYLLLYVLHILVLRQSLAITSLLSRNGNQTPSIPSWHVIISKLFINGSIEYCQVLTLSTHSLCLNQFCLSYSCTACRHMWRFAACILLCQCLQDIIIWSSD